MSEEIKERTRDYLYKGSVCENPEIRADENIICGILNGIISEQPTQSCAIPIRFVRK